MTHPRRRHPRSMIYRRALTRVVILVGIVLAPLLISAPSQAERLSCRWDAWLRATVCDHQGERVATCKPNRWTRRTDCKSQSRSTFVAPAGSLAPWRNEKGQWKEQNRSTTNGD